jgi:hypothetical protein
MQLLAIVLLLVGFVADAHAQRQPLGEQRPRGGQPRSGDAPLEGADLRPGEIQRIFDGYLLVQVQEALGLNNDQFAQIVPRVKALQDARRRHQQERARLLSDLQRLSRPQGQTGTSNPPDDTLLKERLAAFQENDARFAADLRKAYNDIDQVLDLRQQARFRVFEEAIERKKLDLLLRARQNQERALQKRPPPH